MRKLYCLIVLLICAFYPVDMTGQKSGEENKSSIIKERTITNLYDAFGEERPGLKMDFGFSCIMKYNGKTILFDAGSNADIFKQNVEALNIDLKEVDMAIASHAHFDHINGFDYLLEVNPDVKIYFPFDLFWGANVPFDISGQDPTAVDSLEKKMQYFGGDFDAYRFNQSGRFWKANVEFVKENVEIAEGVKLILTTSSNMGYFSQYPKIGVATEEGKTLNNTEDKTKLMGLKEISLSLDTEEGEVVIVGCSHSTVEKIIVETKRFTQNDIAMVYGGYHLLPYKRNILEELAHRLKSEYKVKKVAPAHCTGHLAFRTLKKRFGENYVFAGLGEVVGF